MLLQMNHVSITATFFLPGKYAGLLQVGEDAHCCALSNTDPVSYISYPRARVLCKADQSMCVVAQKIPRWCGLTHGKSSAGNAFQDS